jgi:Aldo/keto reductase family
MALTIENTMRPAAVFVSDLSPGWFSASWSKTSVMVAFLWRCPAGAIYSAAAVSSNSPRHCTDAFAAARRNLWASVFFRALVRNGVQRRGCDWRLGLGLRGRGLVDSGQRARRLRGEYVGCQREEKSATPGQVALAWLLHQGNDIVPIPGTKRRKYLEENLAAAALELSPADLEKVGGFVSSHKVSGPRYNTADLAAIDR